MEGTVTREYQGYNLNYSKDGIDFKITNDKDYKIIGENNTILGVPVQTYYHDYRESKGILSAHAEVGGREGETYEINITKISGNDPETANWGETVRLRKD